MVKHEEALIGSIVIPTLIPRIWHRGKLVERRISFSQSIVKWYMEVLSLVAFFIC